MQSGIRNIPKTEQNWNGLRETMMDASPPQAAPPEGPSAVHTARIADGTLWIYTATIFVSAFLLFLVQPMFSKMVLPLLGGTPSVWNTCMLFFQACLLGGYLYAHLGTRWLGSRRHSVVHLALLGLAFLVLPLALPAGLAPEESGSPVLWLFGVLTVSLGLPFFAISASGPLLQKWFSETGHPDAGNPYFLYAASNVGSMMALLGYPFLIEPRLRLPVQSTLWSVGYGVLALLFAGCAYLLWTRSAAMDEATVTRGPMEPAPSSTKRAMWVLLAFIPSSLLLGVTGFLTTDVAAVPLLWILPLAIYLLTFVLVFARRPPIPHGPLARVQPFPALLTLLTIAWGVNGPPSILYPIHLVTFFILAMVAHGELVRRRPGTAHLTEFYLWMSFGGVLGGVFNVLIAPNLFDSVLEYPIAIALACLLRPTIAGVEALSPAGKRSLALVVGLLLGAIAVGFLVMEDKRAFFSQMLPAIAVLWSVAAVRDRRFLAAGLASIVLLTYARGSWHGENLHTERTFFAVHRVYVDRGNDLHYYAHGTTVHGLQSRDPARRTEALSYYSSGGPLGPIFSSLPRSDAGNRVAVVGLGTGVMACYAHPADTWTFYEIDPAVERIARDQRLFTYLADCAPGSRVILGDARITLAGAPEASIDLLFLDAFSSDAIPAHLLTREALAMYLTKLSEAGVIAFHISNRHLDLEPMLARLAREMGLFAMIGEHAPTEIESAAGVLSSRWLIMARSRDHLGALADSPTWREAHARSSVPAWTDDFSNILAVLIWKSPGSGSR